MPPGASRCTNAKAGREQQARGGVGRERDARLVVRKVDLAEGGGQDGVGDAMLEKPRGERVGVGFRLRANDVDGGAAAERGPHLEKDRVEADAQDLRHNAGRFE